MSAHRRCGGDGGHLRVAEVGAGALLERIALFLFEIRHDQAISGAGARLRSFLEKTVGRLRFFENCTRGQREPRRRVSL